MSRFPSGPHLERLITPHLLKVEKPSRYLPVELNTVDKPSDEHVLRAAIIYPDTYEIGMSHYGLQVLYHIGNRIPSVRVERSFAPWVDMAAVMKDHHIPLYTLESLTPLANLDVVAFTLMTELSYSNILFCLDLAGIPLRAAERAESDPVILGGGICSTNPEPLKRFFDGIGVGDGEILWESALVCLRENRDQPRFERLKALSELEGWMVPSVSYHPVKRVFARHLESHQLPVKPVVPAMTPVHERFAVEVMRGCSRGCRYCQAGFWYRPVRERESSEVALSALEGIRLTGWNEVGFLSLSTTDHSSVLQMADWTARTLRTRHVGLSLPSSRVDTISLELLDTMSRERKFGLTLAPEAGTERLRRVINKDLSDADILDAVKFARQKGWKKIKLYFMIGLPTETRDDVLAIPELAAQMLAKGMKEVVVHVSNFIPKPWTPFQRVPFDGIESLTEKQELLKHHTRSKKINLKLVNPDLSMVESVLSRSGDSGGALLEDAFREGICFDGWTDQFRAETWKKIINLHLPGLPHPLRGYDVDEILPWETSVDPLITRSFFEKEYTRALEETVTPDCRHGCAGCGIPGMPEDHDLVRPTHDEKNIPPAARVESERYRYLVRVTKSGRAVFLSYRDYQSYLVRLFLLCGVPFHYAGKFHPRPSLMAGPALPVGVSSLDECFEVTTVKQFTQWAFPDPCRDDGIELKQVERLDENTPRLSRRITGYLLCLAPLPQELPGGFNATWYDGRCRLMSDGEPPPMRAFLDACGPGTTAEKVRTLLD